MLIVMVQIKLLHHRQALGQHVLGQSQAIGTGRIGEATPSGRIPGLAVAAGTGTVELEPFQMLGLADQVRVDVADNDVGFFKGRTGLAPSPGQKVTLAPFAAVSNHWRCFSSVSMTTRIFNRITPYYILCWRQFLLPFLMGISRCGQ